ncbi:class I SAM-dependent DNA methyltransferase [Nocardia brasiliensis]|uniref:class I SAM-dependent DNA methyltransferase n=1 Tax=Nocardia brasiliensis TaxID=37326 RepID=UPI00245500E6|nr:class I SAM-dependent DNA methyltransferase [Nocardia brasiliensis]
MNSAVSKIGSEDEARALVNRLWSYCEILRHSGVSTLDYVEQLTYLLFLKMVQERKDWPFNRLEIEDKGFDWNSLVHKSGHELADRYAAILAGLGQMPGMIGAIFKGAQSKIQEPAVLEKLVKDLINKHQWNMTGADVKGDAYEGLLQRGAEDRKTGAGQYFTPRPIIDAMVECLQPEPHDTIIDPACGTGGFLIAAAQYINRHFGNSMTAEEQHRLRNQGITGVELVAETARLALMNMLLHDLGLPNGNPVIEVRDSLAKSPTRHASIVLANPPFGVGTISGANYSEARQDLWTSTTNKQFNFLQHIFTLLDSEGRAAVVLPDNVLFEGGAGTTIREKLLRTCDVHTLLRLPTGIFYANGVKANVLFFDKRKPKPDAAPATTKLWVYDFRTNQHFTLKQNPLRRQDLDEFLQCYMPGRPRSERVESTRFKAYSYKELIARDKVSLDLTFLKDDSLTDAESLPAPEVLVQEIIDDLQAALTELQAVGETLGLSLDELDVDSAALSYAQASGADD